MGRPRAADTARRAGTLDNQRCRTPRLAAVSARELPEGGIVHDAKPIITSGQVEQHVAAGAESVTLTRYEWEEIMSTHRGYMANMSQVRKAEEETARIRKISLPMWYACRRVAREIRECTEVPTTHQLVSWEIDLRLVTEIDWRDLPTHKRGEFKR